MHCAGAYAFCQRPGALAPKAPKEGVGLPQCVSILAGAPTRNYLTIPHSHVNVSNSHDETTKRNTPAAWEDRATDACAAQVRLVTLSHLPCTRRPPPSQVPCMLRVSTASGEGIPWCPDPTHVLTHPIKVHASNAPTRTTLPLVPNPRTTSHTCSPALATKPLNNHTADRPGPAPATLHPPSPLLLQCIHLHRSVSQVGNHTPSYRDFRLHHMGRAATALAGAQKTRSTIESPCPPSCTRKSRRQGQGNTACARPNAGAGL